MAKLPGQTTFFQNSHFANGDSLDDNISTIVNNSNNVLKVWENANQSGRFVVLSGHISLNLRLKQLVSDPNTGAGDQEFFNDVASSARLGWFRAIRSPCAIIVSSQNHDHAKAALMIDRHGSLAHPTTQLGPPDRPAKRNHSAAAVPPRRRVTAQPGHAASSE